MVLATSLAFAPEASAHDWSQLRAVAEWTNDKTYFFFSNGTYTTYDNQTGKMRKAAKKVSEGWRGVSDESAKMIVGATTYYNGKAYLFLADGQFIRYDIGKRRVDRDPASIASSWRGMDRYADKIVGVSKYLMSNQASPEKLYFFLRDGTYVRYDRARKIVDQEARPLWPKNWNGMKEKWAKGVVGVTTYTDKKRPKGRRYKTYFFVNDGTYVRYDNDQRRVGTTSPKSTRRGWEKEGGAKALNSSSSSGWVVGSACKLGPQAKSCNKSMPGRMGKTGSAMPCPMPITHKGVSYKVLPSQAPDGGLAFRFIGDDCKFYDSAEELEAAGARGPR